WYHAALAYDGTTARLYLNGILEAAVATSMNMDVDGQLVLGAFLNPVYHDPENQNYFSGLVDEAAVYNRVLTPTEIQAIFAAGTSGKGNNGVTSTTTTITNVAPVVTITGPSSGAVYAVGAPVTFTGTFTDAGTADTHTAQWLFDTTSLTGT